MRRDNKEVSNMKKYLSSRNALKEIGKRIRAYRIDYPLSQAELAKKSGIAIRSISRLENGEDIQFGNLFKVLIALDLDANIDMLVPDSSKRPSMYEKKITAINTKFNRVFQKKENHFQKKCLSGVTNYELYL